MRLVSSSAISPAAQTRFVLGQFGKVPRHLRRLVLFSKSSNSFKEESSNALCSSDFENKFVCGEIMSYDDLREYGSESAVKAAGKVRQQGKPYESASPYDFFPSPS